jgi:putative hydrolase of the HAD superfamily
MPAIAAVTFDFHDTLVSSASWLHLEIHTLPAEVLARLAQAGALPPSAGTPDIAARAVAEYEAIREEAKASGREVTAAAGVGRVLTALNLDTAVTPAQVDAAIESVERACLDDAALVPGVREVLGGLQGTGTRLAVVSSAAYPPFVRWGLDRYDLAGYFPVVATSGDTGYYKSDPRLYAWALARMGVAPAQAVHVGDHPRFDVQGAQAAGMRAVLFTRGGTHPPAADCRPDATVAHMADLPTVLADLAAAG